MSRKTQRVVLKSQAREIISKVYDFMKAEATKNFAQKLTDAHWRASEACGVSERTVTKVLSARNTLTSESIKAGNNKKASDDDDDDDEEPCSGNSSTAVFTSATKKKKIMPKRLKLTELDVGVIRRTIQNYHKEFGLFPTLSNIRNVLKDRMQLDYASKNTFIRLLHKLGYRWKKAESHKRVLTEKHEIQMSRLKYLKQIKSHREAGKVIVYTGQTYLNDSNTSSTELDNKQQQGVAKGMRMIIIHAGSKQGFVPNALLIYKAEMQAGNIHENGTSDTYLKWVKEMLIPNLPKEATIVMDNRAYNNAMSVKLPPSNSSKLALQNWLGSKKIPFPESFEKLELYDLILKNKETVRRFTVDDVLNEQGFSVLRLPANHPELNPIENIWDIAKNYVANNNSSTSEIALEAFQSIGSDVWATTCRHVENIESQYLSNLDLDYNLVINDDDSDSESNELGSSNDNDSE